MTAPPALAAGSDSGQDGRFVGRPLPRLEDARLLTGKGRYVGNRRDPQALQVVFVRSTMAHARVLAVDTTGARALPGVVAVLAAGDLGEHAALPVSVIEPARFVPVGTPLLATGRVRFVGEPLAAVLAASFSVAVDAAEQVVVDYEPLPVVTDAASAEQLPPLHDEAPDNVLLRAVRRGGDVEAAFAAADEVVEAVLHLPRLVAAPIEARAAMAVYDAASDVVTLHVSAQDPHRQRANLAAALRRPIESVRVVVQDVGGAFGSKGSLAPEAAVVALAAIKLGRPVQWLETRSENFLAAPQGRGQTARAALALDRSGRFLGLRVSLTADLGAYLRPDGLTPAMLASSLVAGVYDIAAVEVEVTGVATNKVPTGPYRGAGRPEGAFVAERLADLAARRLGIDPCTIRRRNLVQPDDIPYRMALGDTLDGADLPLLLDRAQALIDYAGTRRQHRLEREAGRLPGLGVALFLEPTGRGLWESASTTLGDGGEVLARVGSTSHGQGHETIFAQVVADELGVHPGLVTVACGDSALVPEGMGTYASRSAMLGGSALLLAARELREHVCLLGADLLGAEPSEVGYRAARVAARDGTSAGLEQIAAHAARAGRSGELHVATRFALDAPLFATAAFAVEVEIDRETGALSVRRVVAVHDGGRILNPLVAEGQVAGAMLQGLGEAVSEEAVYDEDGQLLNGSFLAYGVLSAVEAPPLQSVFLDGRESATPIGAKGIGETGTTGMPAAIVNAACDALAHLGVDDLAMPLTPERLWRAIGSAPRS